jgi:hypothetical protein
MCRIKFELAETLPAEELAVVKQVRAFMETKVAPIITKYWVESDGVGAHDDQYADAIHRTQEL